MSHYDGKIAGLYDLEETLGKGHFAVVKVARHVFTGERVAVKVIDKTKLDEVSKSHLFQEVRCMKLVQHPHIVRLYEVIDTQTKLYLILEFGDGGDMYDYIMKHDKGLDEALAKKYFGQIVQAISYCHKLHVVHRDLKPENVVFFEKLKMVKLTDFGFSNKFCPGQKLETSCGSLAYSAPEILLGDSYDAPAVDVWSLGVLLYMLVCGRPPFQEANDSETLTMIMDCKYSIPTHVSKSCRRLIKKMLIRDPTKRAKLEDIASEVWLKEEMNSSLASMLPMVSREQLTDEDHNYIIQKMVTGNIASKDEIISALDKKTYDHVTATYFLLAERKLRASRLHHADLINKGLVRQSAIPSLCESHKINLTTHTSHSSSLENLLFEDTSLVPENKKNGDLGDQGISPFLASPSPNSSYRSDKELDWTKSNNFIRKHHQEGALPSCVIEPILTPQSTPQSSCSSSPTSPEHPSKELIDAIKSKLTLNVPGDPHTSSPKYKTLPSPNRKLKSVKSSPQLTLNEIFEEGETDCEVEKDLPYSQEDLSFCSGKTLNHLREINSPIKDGVSPVALRRCDHRRRIPKGRTPSGSSSDASDDDSQKRKRKANKIKNIPRRDSHDDSSDSTDHGGGTSGGANLGGGGGHLSRADYPQNNSGADSQNVDDQSGSSNAPHAMGTGPGENESKHKLYRSARSLSIRLRESQSLNRISELHVLELTCDGDQIHLPDFNLALVTVPTEATGADKTNSDTIKGVTEEKENHFESCGSSQGGRKKERRAKQMLRFCKAEFQSLTGKRKHGSKVAISKSKNAPHSGNTGERDSVRNPVVVTHLDINQNRDNKKWDCSLGEETVV